MAQQITVIVKVDVENAIADNSLAGNIYLLDNLKTEGSQHQGTDHLISAAKGFTWGNGGQASSVVFNWLITSINALPLSIPSRTPKNNAIKSVYDILSHFKSGHSSQKLKAEAKNKLFKQLTSQAPIYPKIRTRTGEVIQSSLPLVKSNGHLLTADDPKDTLVMDRPPIITNIFGEAVEEQVLFPAQYGTPIEVNSGWYWSASTNTNKSGTYSYTMEIQLYKLEYQDDEPIWEPIRMLHDASVQVTNQPMVNGFTHGPIGYLPIC